jgi:biotin carboxyl carrier protein
VQQKHRCNKWLLLQLRLLHHLQLTVPAAADENSNMFTIKSPMIAGTFHRKTISDKLFLLKLGSTIEGYVLCVVEAMRLFNVK